PGQVSGGQLHRACLARALAQRPRYLIADEPTAHLDPESSDAIAAVLRARADRGLGVLAISHEERLAAEWAAVVRTMAAPAGPAGSVVTAAVATGPTRMPARTPGRNHHSRALQSHPDGIYSSRMTLRRAVAGGGSAGDAAAAGPRRLVQTGVGVQARDHDVDE